MRDLAAELEQKRSTDIAENPVGEASATRSCLVCARQTSSPP
jgi:hypothetical protein